MAIYLDEQTRPYLERIIKKQVEASDKDFIAKRIDDMLKSDRQRIEDIGNCKHIYEDYIGEKNSCSKCGTYKKETWIIKNLNK